MHLLVSPTAGGPIFNGTSLGADINHDGIITRSNNDQISNPYTAFLWDTCSGPNPAAIYLTPMGQVSNAYDSNLSQVVG